MTINHNHILSLLQTGFTTVQISFEDNEPSPFNDPRRKPKTYTYKALLDDKLVDGDSVIVDSPHNGLTIAHVVKVDAKPRIDLNAAFPYKWIDQKVDRARYDDLLRQEEEFKDALLEVERVRQTEEVLKGFKEHLPPDSEARKLFDATVERAKALNNAD